MYGSFEIEEGNVFIDGKEVDNEFHSVTISAQSIVAFFVHDGECGKGSDLTIITDTHTFKITGYEGLGNSYGEQIRELLDEPVGMNCRVGKWFDYENFCVDANLYNQD